MARNIRYWCNAQNYFRKISIHMTSHSGTSTSACLKPGPCFYSFKPTLDRQLPEHNATCFEGLNTLSVGLVKHGLGPMFRLRQRSDASHSLGVSVATVYSISLEPKKALAENGLRRPPSEEFADRAALAIEIRRVQSGPRAATLWRSALRERRQIH
jgi:hypothetical protein